MPSPVILITGSARRIGAAIARHLHAQGCDLALHYHQSAEAMAALITELEQLRPNSTHSLQADLTDIAGLPGLIETVIARFGRLDGLVNNASAFFATPVNECTEAMWDELMTTNAKAPFFLTRAAAPHLKAGRGAVVNVVDIYGERPLPKHPIYSVSKAALNMVTRALAQALAPEIRVNAISPGTVLWSENAIKAETAEQVESSTALRRLGEPHDIAKAVHFLLFEATYTTGSQLPVEGGRLLHT